jgi:hypothetical protein
MIEGRQLRQHPRFGGGDPAAAAEAAADDEARFRQLEQLVRTAPQDWGVRGPIPPDMQLWLGRVQAAVRYYITGTQQAILQSAAAGIAGTGAVRDQNVQTVISMLYAAFARAELKAPASLQGAFIGVGKYFDVFKMMSKLLEEATRDVLVVDPYIDDVFLKKFAPLAPAGVSLRLLGGGGKKYRECGVRLLLALSAWRSEYGQARPIESRRAEGLHNRYIIIDGGAKVWDIGQSVRNLVDHSPTGFNLVVGEQATETAEHYLDAWTKATPHV